MDAQAAYAGIMELLESMEIVDSHEHLPAEKARLAQTPDFSLLFSHYCASDLQAAGMGRKDLDEFLGGAPPERKWELFEPFYRRIQDGSYCRAAHLAMERFYGIPFLETPADAMRLTAAVRGAQTAGLYRRVLKEACRIRVSMNFGSLDDDPEYFAPVLFCTSYAECGLQGVRDLEDRTGVSCGSLDGYVEAVHAELSAAKARGMRGMKLHFAYMRDLAFAPRTRAEAEAVFHRVVEEGYGRRGPSLGYEEARPLQDYMVHRLVEMSVEFDVPLVIHSALQTDTGHNAWDARPLPLWNLPHRYRRARFVILHSGLPWMEEAALLAKHYPNVYLDMGWDHLMSPTISRRGLSAWIDLVPMHKIFGFGGDYSVVEKVYGHLVLARRDIAAVLAERVASGEMSGARAAAWARAMLADNPAAVYRV